MKPFLSQAEMSERKENDLCYHCDEKFTPEHYLKHKKTQLFSMECEEEEGMEDDESKDEEMENTDKAQISLNAITGVSYYTTMRVRGIHGNKILYVLIDSGSTHNFVDKRLTEVLGCKLDFTYRRKVLDAEERFWMQTKARL